MIAQVHHRAHVDLIEGREHGSRVLRLLEPARDGLAQPRHLHALFACGVVRRRRRAHLHGRSGQQAAPPSEEILDSELQEAIDAAIASLPETQRLAIVLRRYESMPDEEIAEVLKTSVPAVKSILFRARAELKARLKKYLE